MSELAAIFERLRARAEALENDPAAQARFKAEAEAERQRLADQYLQTRLRLSGVPERMIDLVGGGLNDTEAMTTVRVWEEGAKTFLFLAGGVFVKAGEVTRLGAFRVEEIQRLERAKLLVLDDLGREPLDAGGWAETAMHALLDRRYEDKRRTIVTTNLTASQFRDRYGRDGGRLVDRLREAGAWVNLVGESMRKAQ